MERVPEQVAAWAAARADARSRRDFARADELRDRIRAAGWAVEDASDGFRLHPADPGPAVSLLVETDAWPDDAARFLASVERHAPAGAAEVVTVTGGDGFAAARNRALRAAGADVVVLVDTALELTGDLVAVLVEVLAEPGVAVAGPYGLASADLRDYEERTVGEVAAVQGYCLAARRAEVLAVGGLREAFAFYRNADIDLSLRLRTLVDGPPRRAVAVGADYCVRHAHRAWEATPPAEREAASRRNMGRVLRRFGDRLDLAVP